MSRLVTGLPGAGKTAFTLNEFLMVTGRPKYATEIKGLDYQKHGIIKLNHFSDWVNCPDSSLIFVDEVQQFARTRGPRDAIPQFLQDMETHRHRGIDIWCTTQHPKMVDIQLRRLCNEHYHYYRPFMQRKVTLFQWNQVQDDPEDRQSVFKAVKSRVSLPDDVFKQYTSTVDDTYKPTFPKKLLLIPVLIIGFIACMWMGFNAIFGDKKTTQQTTQMTKTEEKGVLDNLPSLVPDLSAPAQAIGSNVKERLSIQDFTPVTPVAPWSAPYYDEIAKPVTMPRFAGCMRSFHKAKNKMLCRCVTQQGTTLSVDDTICSSVVDDDGMPFDPFRADPQSQQLASSTPVIDPRTQGQKATNPM